MPGLDKVVYHAKLGSMGERVQRVRTIARAIGEQLGGPSLAAQAERAALLAKADLLTDMVGEFPELQGVMGGYYARHDGESEAIALAIEDHYKPRFAGDVLPRNERGCRGRAGRQARNAGRACSASGRRRRATRIRLRCAARRSGVLRMLMERAPPLDLSRLVELASGAFERSARLERT